FIFREQSIEHDRGWLPTALLRIIAAIHEFDVVGLWSGWSNTGFLGDHVFSVDWKRFIRSNRRNYLNDLCVTVMATWKLVHKYHSGRFPVGDSPQFSSKSFDSQIRADNKLNGTSNGIVCLARRNIVLLLNPTTREFKVVRFGEEFDFDCHQNSGLGYDGANDDYVLVKFINGNGCESSINVYSVNNTSCSAISDVPYRITDDKALGICLNGAFYWLAYGKGKYSKAIISLILSRKHSEMFRHQFVWSGGSVRDSRVGADSYYCCHVHCTFYYSTAGALFTTPHHGRCSHGYLNVCGFAIDTSICKALIDMYSKCGRIDFAGEVFNGISKRDIISWNTMIAGYGIYGLGKEALLLFHDL
ncbi:hypothetical protein IFM89_027869, partial [Coptis chinensis]